MAVVTALSRCDGQNHIHLTVTEGAQSIDLTFTKDDLMDETVNRREQKEMLYERIKLLVREAKASGATTFAQIRTYILNRAFVV